LGRLARPEVERREANLEDAYLHCCRSLFAVDAIFMTLAKPIADWIDKHVPLRRLRSWIRSLPPYPSLALFSIPVIVLEADQGLGGIPRCDGSILSGALTYIVGELLKLVLAERLFSLTREANLRGILTSQIG
jgi:hypothetical protein